MTLFRPVVLVSFLREGMELAYESAHEQIPDDLFQALTDGESVTGRSGGTDAPCFIWSMWMTTRCSSST